MRDPFGLTQLVLRTAVTLFVAALLLYWAAELIAAVWPWLVGTVLTILFSYFGITALRWWRNRWW